MKIQDSHRSRGKTAIDHVIERILQVVGLRLTTAIQVNPAFFWRTLKSVTMTAIWNPAPARNGIN